jgi:hypothetical protein
MNSAALEVLGDSVLICGEPVRACFDFEPAEKFDFGNGVGQQAERISIEWLAADAPNVRAGDSVVFDGRAYKVKNGFPINMRDCWLRAELSDCGTCK